MALSVKHKFVSPKQDGDDNTLVQPSNWNDEHQIKMASGKLVGRATAGDGDAEEIEPKRGLELSSGELKIKESLDVGFTTASQDKSTVSSGTFTPSFTERNVQHITNGGSFTLGVPTGHGSMMLDIINGSSAGEINTDNYDLVTGDEFTTDEGAKFRCFITVGQAGSHLHVVAFQ